MKLYVFYLLLLGICWGIRKAPGGKEEKEPPVININMEEPDRDPIEERRLA
jgi:Cu2+-containing amine oxidase